MIAHIRPLFANPATYINRKYLQKRFYKLEVKGPIKKYQAHLISPLFVVPKSEGGLWPIIGLQQINQYIDPHTSRWRDCPCYHPYSSRTLMHLVKVNLNDTYLTVPVAKGSWPLLAFQNQKEDLFQFKVLPFRLYSAFYTSSQNLQSH